MNKKITIYELFRYINKGKAPKRIKVDNSIYNFDYKEHCYTLEEDNDTWLNLAYYIEFGDLDEEVEILDEENDEFEDIEEYFEQMEVRCENGIHLRLDIILNQLIRNQKKIIEKMEEK